MSKFCILKTLKLPKIYFFTLMLISVISSVLQSVTKHGDKSPEILIKENDKYKKLSSAKFESNEIV